MKVIQIVPGVIAQASGPAYSVPGIVRGLCSVNVDAIVYALGDYPHWEMGFPLKMFPRTNLEKKLIPLGVCKSFYRGLIDILPKTDIVHTNGLWMLPTVYPEWAIQWIRNHGGDCKTKLVISPRGALAQWALRKGWLKKKIFGLLLQNRVLRCADMFHATSEKEYEEIRAQGYRQPVAIVPIGMDLPEVGFELSDRVDTYRLPGVECRVSGSEFRKRAQEKVEEWLAGLSEERFISTLDGLLEVKLSSGEYKCKGADGASAMREGAVMFFREFSRKIIQLSDGRCVYFTPDARAKMRNADNAASWAEYAVHAVTSSGKMIEGKEYRERIYNVRKVDSIASLEKIIRDERCMHRLIDAHPENDAVLFIGYDEAGTRIEVVTRLDLFGNAQANLSEVTAIVTRRGNKRNPPPKNRPLTEVVETVAKHQAAGFSPSTTIRSISDFGVFGKGGMDKKILFFGRLHKVKGVDRLLLAGEKVAKDGWELVIAGPDCGMLGELQGIVAERKLPRVSFVGEINGPAKYGFLADGDIYVLPSDTENFGVTVAEALVSGTPVIASQGTPWQGLERERCGRWVPIGVEPLAGALAELMAMSDEERAAMGARGRAWIARDFSWKGIGVKMKSAYEWLLGKGEKPACVRVE